MSALHRYPHFRRFLAEVVRVLRPEAFLPTASNNDRLEADLLLPCQATVANGKSTPALRGIGTPSHCDLVNVICRPSCVSRAAKFIGVGHAAVPPAPGRRGNRTGYRFTKTEPVSVMSPGQSPAEREFDIVLYGATAFSADRRTLRSSLKRVNSTIALAGRSGLTAAGAMMLLPSGSR